MTYYTVTLRLEGAPAAAVAVEWTNRPAPLDEAGWEPCLRRADGTWRFSSRAPAAAEAPHRRDPGPFADLAIRYRLEPAGPWSAAAEPRKEIVILETREDGTIGPLEVRPALVAAPTLVGSGEIGSELAVEPGLWSGIPAPELAFQWRRDGADLPGATARAYLTGPADDGCALDCAVTATNPAGALTALAGPVAARRAPPRLAEALPEEVFDAGTGPQTVETAFAFAGEALAFSARGAAIDPATGVLTIPTDAPVAGAEVTITATNSGGAVEARLVYTVEAAEPGFGPVPAAVLRDAMLGEDRALRPLLSYGATPYTAATTGAGVSDKDVGHWTAVVARAALAGDATALGGKTPAVRLREQLAHWADGRMPSADGGYRSQFEAFFVATVAMAKLSPVWDELSAAQRTALTLGMKACLVGSAWIHSTTHPFGTGFGSNRSVRGMKAGQINATNYVIGGKLIPFVVARFLDGGPAEATAFLDGFSRAAFHAELAATGRNAAAALTFGQDWTADLWRAQPETDGVTPGNFAGAGPTAAQLAAALDSWRIQVAPGAAPRRLAVDQAAEAFVDAVGYNFRHVIRPGPDWVGEYANAVDPYGIMDTTRTPPEHRAVIASVAARAGLPNAGLVGMAQELKGSDAQGGRSSMSYVYNGYIAHMALATAMTAQGLAPDADVVAMATRVRRGTIDLRYRTAHGYLSYAKGGRFYGGGTVTNNENWPTRGDAALIAGFGMGDLVVEACGLDPDAPG